MIPAVKELINAAVATLRNPRGAAQQVMAVRMPRNQRWEVLLLISVLSAGLAYISVFVGTLTGTPTAGAPIEISPIGLGISQLAVLLAMVFAIHFIGQWAGGTGGLDDAILLVSWMQFILICLQVLQILAVLFFPFLALLMGLAGLVLVFVLLTIFISELHGFKSMSGVFFSVLFVMLGLATLMRFVFGLFGLDVIGVI